MNEDFFQELCELYLPNLIELFDVEVFWSGSTPSKFFKASKPRFKPSSPFEAFKSRFAPFSSFAITTSTLFWIL